MGAGERAAKTAHVFMTGTVFYWKVKKKTLAIEHYIFTVTVCNNDDCFLSIKAGLQDQLGTHFHLELSRMKTLVIAFYVLMAILVMVEAVEVAPPTRDLG